MTAIVDREDIQGVVAFGYRELRAARFLMLRISEPAAARAWLSALAGRLTTVGSRRGSTAVNIAVTATGVARLGLPPDVVAMFSAEFTEGMVTAGRSRGLGDVGGSAPSAWRWGGPGTDGIDLALLLYGTDPPALEAHHLSHSRDLESAGLAVVATLETSDLGDREPFGFRDGISQPLVEGVAPSGSGAAAVKAGEFLLGYPNEYGLYTDRPLVPATAPRRELLPRDAAGSGRGDLGRNGTYLVVRQLAQDVAGFWRFVDQATRGADGAPNPSARVKLAAKAVGRWPDGAPLLLAPDGDDPSLTTANDFGYFHEDPDGLRCPLGAHIRRTNPRDSLDPKPGTQASVDVGKRHRILRRGREYGTRLTPEQAVDGPGESTPTERGLQFLCVNANIGRQFEFLQRTWVNNDKFNGLYADRDPLIATTSGSTFTVPGTPVRTRVTNLPAFVTVKGGAYFFLPGVRATRYLATLDQ